MREEWRSRCRLELAELADGQHGVVSIRQLEALGILRDAVTREIRLGRLHRIHGGVYAVGHTDISQHGRCLAAVLACGRDAVLSHRSAAWLWGLTRRGPAPYEVTTPIPRRRKPPLKVHYSRGIVEADRRLEERIPVTAVPRTLLDCAASVREVELERMLERAEELRLFDLNEVEALLERTVGHPGHGRLRQALALYREPAFTRSGLERRFLSLVEKGGLPRPSTGCNVAGFELDFYWPAERFAVELDTYATHGGHAPFERDRRRQEDLMLAGVELTRVTDRRLAREPERVVERVARLLELRRREG